MLDRWSRHGGRHKLGIYGVVTASNVRILYPSCVREHVPNLHNVMTVTDPAIVYDPETETRIQVHPDDLLEHFRVSFYCTGTSNCRNGTSLTDDFCLIFVQAHPLHVIDVSTKPEALCRRCTSQNRTFKYCHVDKGHPML